MICATGNSAIAPRLLHLGRYGSKAIKTQHLDRLAAGGLRFTSAYATSPISLNTELVKKPKHLLEYVIVLEMAHLLEPTQSDRFLAILDAHYPQWREARAELNELPLTAEVWK